MLEVDETAAAAVVTPANTRIAGGFYVILISQFVSMLGSQLTAFGLGVWLFRRTGSVLNFSELTLFATLPALLMLPLSGNIADRWNRRAILVVAECVALLCAGVMALLLWLDRFTVGQLFILQTVLSISLALQAPAATAMITSMVPKSEFGRSIGLFRVAYAISQFGGPLIAAPLLGIIGMAGIVALDMLTFAAAVFGMAVARFPPDIHSGHRTGESRKLGARDLFSGFTWTLAFLRARPTLATIYAYSCQASFLTGMVVVLIAPMVLPNHSARVLSWILTCGAVGMLAGGLAMSFWGGLRKWTPMALGFNIAQGLAIMVAGFSNSVVALCSCAFVAMLCGSTLTACTSAILRRKVPTDRQGSFAAFQQAVGLAVLPLSAVTGGLLAHFIFEPALRPGGVWFDAVGSWFGTGSGRGTGLLFFVVGLVAAAVSAVGSRDRRLNRFEMEVQDAF